MRWVVSRLLPAIALSFATLPAVTAPADTFEAAWAAYEAARKVLPEKSSEQIGAHAREIARRALDIFEGYPTDPRRWDAAVEVIRAAHGFVYFAQTYRRDEAACAAWAAYAQSLYGQILARADEMGEERVKNAIDAYLHRQMVTPGVGPLELISTVDEFSRRFPLDARLESLEERLYMGLERQHPDVSNQRVQRLLDSQNPGVRRFAEAKTRLNLAHTEPLQMKFIAVDGRTVDLEQLRGKVVLIDFWATWCGPCVAQVPLLRELYEKYRERGFEIVGISLDQASAEHLRAFAAEKGIVWPNHYDGRHWQNEFAMRYAIKSLPTTFLLDKKGLLVSSHLPGPLLEKAVERQLTEER